jgi:hypothetical protein
MKAIYTSDHAFTVLTKSHLLKMLKLFYTLTTISDHCQALKFRGVYHDHIIFVKHKNVKFLLSTTEPGVSKLYYFNTLKQ